RLRPSRGASPMTRKQKPPASLVFSSAAEHLTVRPAQTDDAGDLLELEASARAEVILPADAHVIGEPVTVTRICWSGVARAGLLATCKRGDATYELSLADVVFPAASAGASLVARYRTWLGLAPFVASESEGARPHKVEGDDIVVGKPVDLVVLSCRSNALRCRLLGSAREVTLRTYRLAATPASDDPGTELLLEAQACIDAHDYAEADELLHEVLALDLR